MFQDDFSERPFDFKAETLACKRDAVAPIQDTPGAQRIGISVDLSAATDMGTRSARSQFDCWTVGSLNVRSPRPRSNPRARARRTPETMRGGLLSALNKVA
jgi:hypothetical protein